MMNSSYVNPQRIDQIEIESPVKTFRQSAQSGKVVQYDFLSNSILNVESCHLKQPLSKQHDHLKQYVEEYEKDTIKYQQFKSIQKNKIFYKNPNDQSEVENKRASFQQLRNLILLEKTPIKISRLTKNHHLATNRKQNSLQLASSNKRYTPRLQKASVSLQRPPLLNAYSSRISSPNSQLSEEFGKLIEGSKNFRIDKKQLAKKRKKLTTRSQVYEKDINMLKEQRKSILKIIQKQSSLNPFPNIKQIKPTASDTFNLNFLKYQKIKTCERILKQYHDRRIRRNVSPLQKFQDFIIKQVRFTNKQHKQKLQKFYSHIRQQFRKIQTHKG